MVGSLRPCAKISRENDTDNIVPDLTLLESRLCSIEFMVLDIHWWLVGQWQWGIVSSPTSLDSAVSVDSNSNQKAAQQGEQEKWQAQQQQKQQLQQEQQQQQQQQQQRTEQEQEQEPR